MYGLKIIMYVYPLTRVLSKEPHIDSDT